MGAKDEGGDNGGGWTAEGGGVLDWEGRERRDEWMAWETEGKHVGLGSPRETHIQCLNISVSLGAVWQGAQCQTGEISF